ncbi:hypothetical protein [Mesobacillus zeae]|uniref:Molybdopterin cofactor biosynthesis MoaD-related C-terminal domain-containing protein n=1 Tax=Mesobacillus zeae TaxID=1917180 RepID=A0A398B8H9_9BACI|nr:hypothetical protein [Mesobacillus zeae]RID86285.1 hypothetical protein D1970_07095 [Mesobacillus zeae]
MGSVLEFRGISCSTLGTYFEELGGKKQMDIFPILYKGSGWSGEILKEEVIELTKVISVNKVLIRFSADSDAELNELIKRYRYKTTRIGG